MPLPIAHSAAGVAAYLYFHDRDDKSSWRTEGVFAASCLLLANFPDLDLLLGMACGDVGRFHHGPSHSILVGLILAVFATRFLKDRLRETPMARIVPCCLISALSHPILDCFSADTSEPFGITLFWPFDGRHYISPIPLFLDVQRSQTNLGIFITSLINKHNGMAMVVEALFGGMILLSLVGMKSRARLMMRLLCFAVSFLCGLLWYDVGVKSNWLS